LTILVVDKHLTNIRGRLGAGVQNLLHVNIVLSMLVAVQKVLQANVNHGLGTGVACCTNVDVGLTVVVVDEHLTYIGSGLGARVENLLHVNIMLASSIAIDQVCENWRWGVHLHLL